jgi:rSAM/selenodomain-associated transferase 2
MRLSIIIPVLDEGEAIAPALDALTDLRALGVEVIVADGGSRDATVQRARLRSDRVVAAPRGRAAQLNAGAQKASGDVLLFLNADARLPREAERLILDGLERSGRAWGCFGLAFEGSDLLLSCVAFLLNLRPWITGVASGDQAIFAKADAFRSAGGFPAIPLIEDIALCKSLKRFGRPLCLPQRVVTLGRRLRAVGVLPTISLMARLRLAYAFGTDPAELAQRYGAVSAPTPPAQRPDPLNRGESAQARPRSAAPRRSGFPAAAP